MTDADTELAQLILKRSYIPVGLAHYAERRRIQRRIDTIRRRKVRQLSEPDSDKRKPEHDPPSVVVSRSSGVAARFYGSAQPRYGR